MGQRAELRVLRGDIMHGPFTPDQIKDLLNRGQLSDLDLVSVQGGPWVGISEYLATHSVSSTARRNPDPTPEFSFGESTPTPRSEPLPLGSARDWPRVWLRTYRVFLVVAMFGVGLPWYTASTEFSAPIVGAGASRASLTGFSVFWGIFSFLFLLAGGVASFVTRSWKVYFGLAVAAFAVVVLAAVNLSAASPFGMNFESDVYGATTSLRAGLSWGIWLTLVASGVAAGAAWLVGVPDVETRVEKWATTKLVLLVATITLLGLLLTAFWTGTLPVPFRSNVPSEKRRNELPPLATHRVAEDVCLYLFELGDFEQDDSLTRYLFYQQFQNPLAGNSEPEHAIVLEKDTKLRVVKTQIKVTSGDSPEAYPVHFATVASGNHLGKEGWITDRYLRPAN